MEPYCSPDGVFQLQLPQYLLLSPRQVSIAFRMCCILDQVYNHHVYLLAH
jgi:hypothetical protein